jgi:hypothetical protein
MKLVIAPIFLLLVLIQTFSKWIIWADYELNKDYIAKVLCENKKRPMLHCNGKCQLAKKMAAEEADAKKSARNSTSAGMQFSNILFDDFLLITAPPIKPREDQRYTLLSSAATCRIYLPAIFHPPLV